MTNWKARCAELEGLLTKLHEYVHSDARFLLDEDSGAGVYGVELDISIDESLTRTRTALAKPEPEGPSVEAMAQIVYELAMLATAPEHAKPHWPSWGDLPNSDARIHSLNTAEIILAHFGRPAIEPEGTTRREALIHFESFAATFQASGGDSDLILRALAEAALAQPAPEGPTDEQLNQLHHELWKDGVHSAAAYGRAVLERFGRPAIEPVPVSERLPGPTIMEIIAMADEIEEEGLGQVDLVRRALARFARPAIQPVPTPEPGVADHITDDEGTRWDHTMDAALWAKAFCLICPEMASQEDLMIGWFANAIMAGCDHQAWKMDAERKPVPVSERPWEREGWCDAKGRCWWGRGFDDMSNCDWFYSTYAEMNEYCENAMPTVSLPHYALPVPNSQEIL